MTETNAPDRPRPFTRWRHLKTGNEYVVLGVGMIEATLTAAVLYRRAVGDPLVWVRPLAEFLDGRFVEIDP